MFQKTNPSSAAKGGQSYLTSRVGLTIKFRPGTALHPALRKAGVLEPNFQLCGTAEPESHWI